MKYPSEMPSLVYADSGGQIYDLPELKMAGRSGRVLHPVDLKDLIPLPEGSELFVLPDRQPVGWDQDRDDMVVLNEDPANAKEKVRAVAAFMAPAHTQTALAAFHRSSSDIPPLPLFTYTAVGWWKGHFWAAGFRSDHDKRQDFCNFRPEEVRKKTIAMLKKNQKNRLIQHLGKCSLTYGCPAAKNLFLGRWEGPLPTSPVCNAACLGCISFQSGGVPPASQDRITFVPTTEEVAGVAVPHLKRAKRPVMSFGQGCEGEPLLQAKLLERSVIKIREETDKGTINLNTNASLPKKVQNLISSGLDSIRISMNSTRRDYYHAYFRPKGYDQNDVLASWRIMKEAGRFVSINLFVLPGLTDEMAEIDRLSDLIEELGLDLIQLRNHSIDPDWYLDGIGYEYTGHRTGIKGMVKILKKRFPKLRFGYFNPYLRSD